MVPCAAEMLANMKKLAGRELISLSDIRKVLHLRGGGLSTRLLPASGCFLCSVTSGFLS